MTERSRLHDPKSETLTIQKQIRVTSHDDAALWRFFESRRDRLTRTIETLILQNGRGRIEVRNISYERGSVIIVLTIVIIGITVLAQYPQLKANMPEVVADAAEVMRWLENEILPELETTIESFFEEFLLSPLTRLFGSIFRAIFGSA
jgi:hypothetical protein